MVPEAGLEPARSISPVDFESTASTNSTTRACHVYYYSKKIYCLQHI